MLSRLRNQLSLPLVRCPLKLRPKLLQPLTVVLVYVHIYNNRERKMAKSGVVYIFTSPTRYFVMP